MKTLLALLGLVSVALAAEPDAKRDALFANTSGWIGADGDYSVTLSPEKSLWFFSDTWIGEIKDGKRRNATLINNSVGVMTKDGVKYTWGKGTKPAAFFTPEDGRGWLWPFAGVSIGGRVHLLLWQMEKATGPQAFAFRNVAVWHAVIDNPTEEPATWRIKQYKLPFTTTGSSQLLFGSAMLEQGEHVFIYGVREEPRQEKAMILARVPKASFSDFSTWQFRTSDGWSRDFKDAASLTTGVASEYSVTKHGDKFVLVTHAPMLSARIIARTSPTPFGPWSEPTTLFTCPEVKWSKENFCYAGKAHAGLSTDKLLTMTYAANSHKFSDVLNDARLYWPRFITAEVPK